MAGPGDGLGDALAGIEASPLVVVVTLAFLGQTWLLWQLFRQHGRLLARVRALEATVDRPEPASLPPVVHRRERIRAVAG